MLLNFWLCVLRTETEQLQLGELGRGRSFYVIYIVELWILIKMILGML